MFHNDNMPTMKATFVNIWMSWVICVTLN